MIFILPDNFYFLKWFYLSLKKINGEKAKEIVKELLEKNKIIIKKGDEINVEEIFI